MKKEQNYCMGCSVFAVVQKKIEITQELRELKILIPMVITGLSITDSLEQLAWRSSCGGSVPSSICFILDSC